MSARYGLSDLAAYIQVSENVKETSGDKKVLSWFAKSLANDWTVD